MEYNKEQREIELNKEVSNLDIFVLDFCKLLKKYVIVSGYVSILFGRARATEDVDILVELNQKEFYDLWKRATENGFECINTSNPKEAFDTLKENAIRFARKGKAIPNIEFKTIKNNIDKYSLNNKIKAKLRDKELFISPLEMQIAYKLFLGSEKDIEDAKHLYLLFKEKLNNKELLKLTEELNAKDKISLLK